MFATGAVFHEIWATTAEPVPLDDDEPSEPTARPLQVPPDAQGTIVHAIDMPPGSGAPMHRTETIDYGIVLTGEIDLELDNGSTLHLERCDIVVQRVTAHAWYNRSLQVTRMPFVMVGFVSIASPARGRRRSLQADRPPVWAPATWRGQPSVKLSDTAWP